MDFRFGPPTNQIGRGPVIHSCTYNFLLTLINMRFIATQNYNQINKIWEI